MNQGENMNQGNCPNPSALQTSILLIDPKDELIHSVRRQLEAAGQSDRLLIPGAQNQISYFEGESNLPATDKLDKLWQVCNSWGRNADSGSGNVHWERLSFVFMSAMVISSDEYEQARTKRLLPDNAPPLLPAEMVKRLNLPHIHEPTDFWRLWHQVLDYARADRKHLKFCADAADALCKSLQVGAAMHSAFNGFTAAHDLIEQFNYVVMGLAPLFGKVTDPAVTEWIDFSFFARSQQGQLSILDAVESGKVIVFSPGAIPQASANFAGRVIKSKFFQAAFCRQNKARPVAYICDEFQRYITTDEESGEQSFLDRCRAHRVMCVLATQSVASLRYAAAGARGANESIDVIFNNTANKVFMRSTDNSTQATVQSLLPPAPSGNTHVVVARPLTTLGVGEAYYLLANGDWGRAQLPAYAAL